MKTNPSLVVSHLSKSIGKTKLLHDISFSLKKGEVLGFLGPNGAGKTTTLKCILSIMKPSEGSISILGGHVDDKAIRKKIGFMPENTYLYKYLTGEEFLDFNASFYDLHGDELQARKDTILKKVGLLHARNKYLHTYSKGMLQRIGLAQSLLHDPEIIFLDEPMSGLDPVGRKMIKDLMLELKAEQKTIFFNTHILSDVEAICDSCAIIVSGHLVTHTRMNELKIPLEDFFMEHIVKQSGDNFIVN